MVIDGANVGFYEQNFSGAPPHVEWNKIDWVVQYLESKNKRVLVVMHSRHFVGRMFPNSARPIVARWEASGSLLKTPKDGNDDWFWLHASLWPAMAQQEVSGRGGASARERSKRKRRRLLARRRRRLLARKRRRLLAR